MIMLDRTLCDNAGFDANNILSKLRQKHAGAVGSGDEAAANGSNFGVDIKSEGITDNFEACVLEPALVKVNAITAASEATCVILSVDQVNTNFNWYKHNFLSSCISSADGTTVLSWT